MSLAQHLQDNLVKRSEHKGTICETPDLVR